MSTLPPIDDRYEITDRIATGGMGEVFRGQDTVLGREVAIKVLHTALANDTGFIDRFRQEARAAAMLNHPNIVAVYDWGNTSGTYFMVMELIEGRSLRDLLTNYRQLDPGQSAEVLHQTLAGLSHAHRQGIVHRDIKPENILVTRDGVVKVADFGLARAYAESRVTQAPGTVTGTVQYLAPEQIQGEPADPRTDIYSLGVVAYELLTGDVPFKGETSVAVAYKHVRERVPPPSKANHSVPKSMDQAVIWSTEKDRDRRPASAEDLDREMARLASELPAAQDLASLVQGVAQIDIPLHSAPTVTIPQAGNGRGGKHGQREGRKRRPLRRALMWLLALGLVLGGGWAAWANLLTAEMPDVVGLQRAEAEAALESANIDAIVGEGAYSSEIPRGSVASQDPALGSAVPIWSSATIHLSLGPKTVNVPDLAGMSQADARRALDAVGLSLGAVSRDYSDEVKENLVMRQEPDQGKVDSGSSVNIWLSQGPFPVAMPSVEGLTLKQAMVQMDAAGLKVATKEKYSQTVARDHVISQSIKAGDPVPPGTKVTLVISLGPKSFPMPDVKGLSQTAATAELKDLGLQVSVSTVPGSTSSQVVGQQPSAGQTVKAGQTVTIFVGG